MQNDAGEFVDLYCPRKCSASNRLIHAKDHASVQLVIADVDPATGRATDSSKMYVICGAIRRMGESDDCIVRLTKKDGILIKVISPSNLSTLVLRTQTCLPAAGGRWSSSYSRGPSPPHTPPATQPTTSSRQPATTIHHK
ncbi:unnamed protein product [Danaus chrysippus]|uniref:Small ribosomal subunit protein eS21 n=1 Tax=Danaus chrysippus TaxID=151541 RepID=A0A8J2VUA2_9NEOP|nr:unnamed protein product [Danaus chrysippus]